jgi:hypothetical protein
MEVPFASSMLSCVCLYWLMTDSKPLTMLLSRALICCWPSPAQLFLVSGPVGAHNHFFKTTYIFFKCGRLFDERKGLLLPANASHLMCSGNSLLTFTGTVILGFRPHGTHYHSSLSHDPDDVMRLLDFLWSGNFCRPLPAQSFLCLDPADP